MMDIETSLEVLSISTHALTTACSLEVAMNSISEMTAMLMDTDQVAVLLRDEDYKEFQVRSLRGLVAQRVQVGGYLDIPDRLKRLLWQVRTVRQIGKVETGINGLAFPLLVVPLRIKGERVGLIVVGKSNSGDLRFSQSKRQLLLTVASFASLVIENAKVHDYLKQQFAQRAGDLLKENRKNANGGDETHQLMVSSLTNPDKVVRLLASSFYKELHKAGFSPGQITTATAEILTCITRETDEKVLQEKGGDEKLM
jgi:GAF domain-containing protein